MPISAAAAAGAPRGAVVPIASIKITGSAVSDATFANIPQIYQDLMLVGSARRTDTAMFTNLLISPYFSGMGSSLQSSTHFQATEAATASFRYTGQDAGFAGSLPGNQAAPNVMGSFVWHCLNYANTTGFKTSISRSAADLKGTGQVRLAANLTRTTGAITVVNVSTFSGSAYFDLGSTFTLYGVRGVGQ